MDSDFLTIGDFSRMTFLSIKALRHYHDSGLLVPARIDTSSGYRFYSHDQIATAQLIRRFRDLDMPLEDIRSVLFADGPEERNSALSEHLMRLEKQLGVTQQNVASLRQLLVGSTPPLEIARRREPSTPSIALREHVAAADLVAWWMDAFGQLHRKLALGAATRTGPDGAIFSNDFFEKDGGEVVAFLPTDAPADDGRFEAYEVPAATVAVAVHTGPFSDLDRSYGTLGAWVADRAIGAVGPIRERYLPLGDPSDLLRHDTEICWPVLG